MKNVVRETIMHRRRNLSRERPLVVKVEQEWVHLTGSTTKYRVFNCNNGVLSWRVHLFSSQAERSSDGLREEMQDSPLTFATVKNYYLIVHYERLKC